MTAGELQNAVRRALNILDAWNDVSEVTLRHSGSYYELQGVIEDAVHCGAQAATGDYRPLESEASGQTARSER